MKKEKRRKKGRVLDRVKQGNKKKKEVGRRRRNKVE